MARKSAEIEDSVMLRTASLDESSAESIVIPFDTRRYPKRFTEIYKNAISSLKIISMGALGEASDFFGSYESYSKISAFFDAYGLGDGSIPVSVEEFSKKPSDCWIAFLVVVMSMLYAMPNNGGVCCVRIVNNADEKASAVSVGIVLSIKLTLEVYDWKEHLLSLYIPDDQTNYRMILMLDNTPALFSVEPKTEESTIAVR